MLLTPAACSKCVLPQHHAQALLKLATAGIAFIAHCERLGCCMQCLPLLPDLQRLCNTAARQVATHPRVASQHLHRINQDCNSREGQQQGSVAAWIYMSISTLQVILQVGSHRRLPPPLQSCRSWCCIMHQVKLCEGDDR